MNELDMLKLISKKLDKSNSLGNDCAKINLNNETKSLFVTHDTLVEDVHFSLKFTTPQELGQKAMAVNISDLCAALAKPLFVTISLSMPANISNHFIEQFYDGINYACKKFGCFVAGGDLTRSEKIVISICAAGQQTCQTNIGRNLAQKNDIVFLCGYSGVSAIGLEELLQNPNIKNIYTENHIAPKTAFEYIEEITKLNPKRFAAMDTSDGLADAVFKISQASNVCLNVDADKILRPKDFNQKALQHNLNPEDTIIFGAEDFSLLFTIPPNLAKKLSNKIFTPIGYVSESTNCGIITINNKTVKLNEKLIKEKTFSHFKGDN